MRIMILAALLGIASITQAAAPVHEVIPLVVPPHASSPEQVAATELGEYLGRLYPQHHWQVVHHVPKTASWVVRIGTPVSAPKLLAHLGKKQLQGAESYVVTTTRIDNRATGIVLGADPAGVMFGVYQLLERLGCGFYPSFESVPPIEEPFSFNAWDLSNHPLTDMRIVFNWHNFLSGCTGWDLENWLKWIRQTQKMGYNTIMVHAYGNNPMFTFTFNGIEKPVGYVATSRRGRDWGNEHVNDVRLIPGGDIFDQAEFGSQAALVPDDQRIQAKQALMQKVFRETENRGMRICFAIDVDTTSVLDQTMILSLNEADRFSNGTTWLPRPDTDSGYRYYKAQVTQLLTLYPEIDIIALWRRSHAAEWGKLKNASQLPASWQKEYAAHIKQHPQAGRLVQSVCSFSFNKVVRAFRKALTEISRSDIQLAMGSWDTAWVPALSEFLDDEVTIMPLDSSYLRTRHGSFFHVDRNYAELKTAQGRVLPIIWSHHDDGDYIGRPIHPHRKFQDKLDQLDARGYGLIHWMIRPFDVYFKNHINQVWAARKNEDYQVTCQAMARHCFGQAQADRLGDYLYQWAMEAPIFGRVTTDHFMLEREVVTEPAKAIAGCRRRIAMLDQADLKTMTASQQEWIAYFRALETMLIHFCEVQEFMIRPARMAIREKHFRKAKTLLQRYHPADTIRQFSRLSQLASGDRGEAAMVLSLGTRWITDYIALRQAVGLEAIRINYGPTQFEPTAQGSGRYTFYIDTEGHYWSVRGQHETGQPTLTWNYPADKDDPITGDNSIQEIAQSGIVIDSPVSLAVSPIVNIQRQMAPGTYRLTLYVAHTKDHAEQFDLSINARYSPTSHCRFGPVQGHFLRLACRGNNQNAWNSVEELHCRALDPSGKTQASDHVSGYASKHACDGKTETRWAAEGRHHWIQFQLKPHVRFDQLEIDWYLKHERRYDYDLLVSDNGKDWSKITLLDQARPNLIKDHIDLTARSDRQTGVCPLSYALTLSQPDEVGITLSPKQGTVTLLGIVLQPEQ